MKTTSAALALAALSGISRGIARAPGSPAAVFLLAPHLAAGEGHERRAVTAATVGSGQLVLDVIDGKAQAAAVAMTLPRRSPRRAKPRGRKAACWSSPRGCNSTRSPATRRTRARSDS